MISRESIRDLLFHASGVAQACVGTVATPNMPSETVAMENTDRGLALAESLRLFSWNETQDATADAILHRICNAFVEAQYAIVDGYFPEAPRGWALFARAEAIRLLEHLYPSV